MSRLPVISGRKAIEAFERDGWVIQRRAKSAHIIMKKAGMITTLSIPEHKSLDRGLLRSLIRDSGLTVEDFIIFLKS